MSQTVLLLVALCAALCAAIPMPHAAAFDEVIAAIEAYDAIPKMTVWVGLPEDDAPVFAYNKADFTPETVSGVTSATKWVTATIVLNAVQDGFLTLDTRPGDVFDWWTTDPADPRARITLRQLLSFTAGITSSLGNSCVINPRTTFDECIQSLYERGTEYEPGTTYYYSNGQSKIAGAMAMAAVGVSKWDDMVEMYLRRPFQIPVEDAQYDFPSESNPDLGGGLSTSVDAYWRLLTAMHRRQWLVNYIDLIEADQSGLNVTYENRAVGQSVPWDFHYGFGTWRECFQTDWDAVCENDISVSSLGASGFYPLIARTRGYRMIIGTENFQADVDLSVKFAYELRPVVEEALFGKSAVSSN